MAKEEKTKKKTTKRENAPRASRRKSVVSVEKFAPLVARIVLERLPYILSAEELESAAWLGVCRAAKSFLPGKGTKLSTWAAHKARFAIADAIRKETKRREREIAAGDAFFLQIPARSIDSEESAEARLVLNDALRQIDDRARDIIERAWLLGQNRSEIARALGISASWCNRLYQRGMKELRSILTQD